MSSTRLNNDACTYQHNLKQSIGGMDYMLNIPKVHCGACFSTDPSLRGKSGAANCSTMPLIDIDSELKSITRKASKCPLQHYIPQNKPFCTLASIPDCQALPREDTRLSNNPCTLRCTGWNRWEWLCQNPQDKALLPFETNINYRTIVKDNHRPCLPVPLDQNMMNPPKVNVSTVPSCTMEADTDVPSVHWNRCKYASSCL
jgi:hypothetical protein